MFSKDGRGSTCEKDENTTLWQLSVYLAHLLVGLAEVLGARALVEVDRNRVLARLHLLSDNT